MYNTYNIAAPFSEKEVNIFITILHLAIQNSKLKTLTYVVTLTTNPFGRRTIAIRRSLRQPF